MQPIPNDILIQFNDILKQRNVPLPYRSDYRKWLRYFLDFRSKHRLPDSRADQVRLFAEKLRAKNQRADQREQAAEAVSLFFTLQQMMKPLASSSAAHVPDTARGYASNQPVPAYESQKEHDIICEPPASFLPAAPRRKGGKQYDEWRCLRKTESPEWDAVIAGLSDEIKIRHYSRKTLKHYADWSRKFQAYLKNKPPEALSPADVKAYLTYLAVHCKVSSSHQNQAFNALLFLYRHVLKQDFGIHKDIPRAKRSNYIPTVLSREIDVVLK